MGAWLNPLAGPLLGAVSAIVVAAIGAWASRVKARRDAEPELRRRNDQLQAQRDTLYNYVFDLRKVLHANDIDPPPWPAHEAPPWEDDRGGPP